MFHNFTIFRKIITDKADKDVDVILMLCFIFLLGLIQGRGGGRHIGHKLRVGGEVGRYTRYSKVLTPYTEHWANNKTKEWYAGKKAS